MTVERIRTILLRAAMFILSGAGVVLFIQAFTPLFMAQGMNIETQGPYMALFGFGAYVGLLALGLRNIAAREKGSE